MTRARAVALSLVNWKGVFFERYWLDRHVTALEGANGAGKTTVMIAAYVVLLPDLQRLKFVNLGETGATAGDRGIWGRLGESGPSYAALEIDLGADQRVLCGVHLERKAAPALSLTPFLITQIPEPVTSQRLLLADKGQHDEIPNLAELARNVAAAGATLEVFGSAKDYFARSFELGISPLRLSTDEDRNKLNDMLRTSMTGGISRTLTSELRSFLFKRETGLFDILSRMRQNLEACRRTRLDVGEARGLEHEISGVYATGHAMFGAALDASRERARESRHRLELAEQAKAEAEQRALELATRLDEVAIRKDSLSTRLAHARKEADAGRDRLSRLERASVAAQRVATARAERDHSSAPAELALEKKTRSRALREGAKAARDAAQATLLRATTGLANLQAGLEELHRQSHAYNRVRERFAAVLGDLAAYVQHTAGSDRGLQDVFESLAELRSSTPAPHQLKDALAQLEEARRSIDRERAEQHRRDATAGQRQQDFEAATAALATISGLSNTHSDAAESAPGVQLALGERARRQLLRLNELEILVTRVDELEREWQRSSVLGRRQAALQSGLVAIGFAPLPSAHEFASKLGSLEQKRRELTQTQQEHELTAARELERARATETALVALLARGERYARLSPVRERIHGRGRPMPQSANDLGEQLRALEEMRRTLHETALRCEAERQEALRLALDCEASATGARGDLEQLAERLDGHLLTTRYEDLEIDEARRTQAELGPLNAAIVVDDPHAALALICAEPHADESVWLIRTAACDTAVGTLRESEQLGHVVVDLGYGLRVTRLPEAVHLGKAARERRARELRNEADGKQHELESAEARLRELEAERRDLAQLWEHWEAWSNGDPSREIDATDAELKQARTQISECQALARQARLDAARVLSEYEAAKALLADHHLLDPPDYEQAARVIRKTLDVALQAQTELASVAAARKVLLGQLHLLDEGSLGAHARDAVAEGAEKIRLDAQRDRLFAATDALGALDREQAAWTWSDAERALGEQTRLAPELEAQHQRAELEVRRAHDAFEAAEAAWEEATFNAQQQSAELAAADAHLARAQAEFEAEGVERPSEMSVGQYQLELSQLGQTVEHLDTELRGIDADLALAHERLGQVRHQLELRRAELERERELEEPAERAWSELHLAAQSSLAFAAEALPANAARGENNSAQLWLEAQSKRSLLADRLLAARDAGDLARASTETWPIGIDLGPRYFELWQNVRSWLARRLPAQLGELNEPLQGLSRLQGDLGQLERRLERQEGDLRGTSGDVARSIDVQVRRAAAQVRRLNASLEGVSFGSIHGIRVQMERVAKMDQVLRALRDGETQELLFQSDLPFEAALDEIFRRHSGGRGGGQRLIDYREYIDLCVSIQRRSDADWERVNPSQVSTGEAIGIGAALMMVILTEWERDDQLLRQKRSLGSLRFLFLDEANRLSQDNLGVLFDLCRTLDLQLLIAAPEVARAEGNTTYRLVRRVNEAGREEVLVSGRRATPPEPDPRGARAVPPPTRTVQQTELFSG